MCFRPDSRRFHVIKKHFLIPIALTACIRGIVEFIQTITRRNEYGKNSLQNNTTRTYFGRQVFYIAKSTFFISVSLEPYAPDLGEM